MRMLLLTITSVVLSCVTIIVPIQAQKTCECKAPDGSCNGRVSCPSGCTALCGSKDACYVACGRVETDQSYARMTIKINDDSSDEVAAVLSQQTGRNIKFFPRNKADRYTFQIENDQIRKAFKYLAKRGRVTVNGVDFERLEELRNKMLKGKIAVNFTDLSIRKAVDDLSLISGLNFTVTSGDDTKKVSLSLKSVSLDELLDQITTQTGVKIQKQK